MADRMVVMNAGRIEQIGAPLDVYDAPQTLYVARFIGAPSINVVEGVTEGASAVKTKGGSTLVLRGERASGKRVSAAFRPEHVEMGEAGALAGRIDVIENLGHETYVFVETTDGRVCLVVDRAQRPRTGEAVRLSVRPEHVHLFDTETGLRLAA